MLFFRRLRLSDWILGFLFIVLVLVGAFSYMRRERMIYSWDEANYTFLTGLTYEAFFPAHPDPPTDTFRPVYGLKNIYGSFAREYNQLFTLPLVFFERAFGVSRTVFVLGVSLLFMVPFSLFWGLVATRMFALPKRAVFWGTLGLILAIPPTYLAVLRGFPDIGGQMLLGLAVLLYLRDIELKNVWQRIAIGIVLCIMPLFRRHFMYGVSAFIVAMILQHAVFLIQKSMRDPKEGGRYFLHMAGRLITIGLTIAAMWLIFAYPFVHILVSNNYFNLYEGFMLAPSKVLNGFSSAYGLVTCLLAVLGYILGYRLGVLRGAQAQFVTVLGSLAMLQWVFVVRQQGTHYLNHFSIYLVLGILALIAVVFKISRGLPRYVLLAVIGVALAYRFVYTFGGMKAVDSPDGDGIAMSQSPPKVRADYNEVKRLITDLRRDSSSGPLIFVAACSWMMNSDVLRNGEEDMFGKANMKLSVLQPPSVDSRDWLPIDLLLKSDVILTVLPIQYSLAPEDEKLVALGVNAMERDTALAKDFEKVPGEYAMESGAVGKLYRRKRTSTLATALSELSREEAVFPTLPGRQKDWISVDGDGRWELQQDKPPYTLLLRENGYRPTTLPLETARHRQLVYVGKTPLRGRIAGKLTLTGHWSKERVFINPVWIDAITGSPIPMEMTKTPMVPQVANGDTLSVPVPPAPQSSQKARLLLEITLPAEADPKKQEIPDGQFILEGLQVR